jgi:hypothetical protein
MYKIKKNIEIFIQYAHGVDSVTSNQAILRAHSYLRVDRICLLALRCSLGRCGYLYKKFYWNCPVGIKAIRMTQYSIFSSPLSTEPVSMRKLALRLHCEGDWQSSAMESSTVLIGTCHSFDFQNIWLTVGMLANKLTLHHWADFLWIFQMTKLVEILYDINCNTLIYQELDIRLYIILI